jgi:hypothetical protein
MTVIFSELTTIVDYIPILIKLYDYETIAYDIYDYFKSTPNVAFGIL